MNSHRAYFSALNKQKGEWERLKRLKTTLNQWSTKAHNREKNTWKKGSRYKVVKIHENSGEKNIQIASVLQ